MPSHCRYRTQQNADKSCACAPAPYLKDALDDRRETTRDFVDAMSKLWDAAI